jgi:hypothetical protein
MNDRYPPPLPPDVAALLAAERTAGPPAGARDRVARRLEASLGLAGVAVAASSAAAPSATAGIGAKLASLASIKIAAIAIATTTAIGGAAYVFQAQVTQRRSTPPVAAPVRVGIPDRTYVPVAAPFPDPIPVPDPTPVPDSVPVPAAPPVRATAPRHAAHPAPVAEPGPIAPPPADLATENPLLSTARAALARGDHASALHILDDHAHRFPSGALAEERDSLRIKSLAAAGDLDTARARASEFRLRYPRSIFLPSIDHAVR